MRQADALRTGTRAETLLFRHPDGRCGSIPAMKNRGVLLAVATALSLAAPFAWAHGVAGGDAAYLKSITGVQFLPLMYLGAKHMVTGYDHLLFLAGVIFFLYRLKDVALYVTLFAIGHSTTLLLGVLGGHPRERVHRRCDHRAFGGLQGAREHRRLRRMGIHIDSRAGRAAVRPRARLRLVDEAAGPGAVAATASSAT